MVRYLMVDLDGTLLPVDLNFFFERYLNALTPHFTAHVEPRLFIKHILASTQFMVDHNDANLTNEDAFWSDFPPRMGGSRDEIEPIFTRFYQEEFPQLSQYVPKSNKALQLLQKAQELGLKIILATNPIFPEFVIRERLAWVDCADIPFLWVTSLENMHYCKPNPKYFQEILDHLNIRAEDCLMVGNDVEEDLPASTVGIKTYLVTDFLMDRGSGLYHPAHRGTIDDLIRDLPEIVSETK